jgi:putative transposase
VTNYHIPLLPGERYHILSRAVGHEKLFPQEANYAFFLSRFQKYILPVANLLCYCLLPNHFHLLIRVKEEKAIRSRYEQTKTKPYSPEIGPAFIMQQFSNWLNSYTKAFNTMYNRKGGLFIDYLRRIEIKNDSQFGATIFYIHKNPIHHGYCEKIEQWQ